MNRDSQPKENKATAADAALDELKRWAHLRKHTGVGYVRVNFNQGGVTSAKASLEESLDTEN